MSKYSKQYFNSLNNNNNQSLDFNNSLEKKFLIDSHNL